MRHRSFMPRLGAMLFLVSFVVTPACGGIDPISGSERGLFAEYTGPFMGRGCSVIVARVLDVTRRKDDLEHYRGSHNVTLEPLMLLAGLLDPSVHPKIEPIASFSEAAGVFTKEPPPKGAVILVVLMENGEGIHSDRCSFMPNDFPLIVLDGLGDKRILETLDRIRKARAVATEREKREAVERKPEEQKDKE
jgi:hypothetical protein